MEGVIKNWIPERGFGFIGVVGQPDVFFHVTQLEEGYEPLRNDVVSFDMDTDPKRGRAMAIDVKRID